MEEVLWGEGFLICNCGRGNPGGGAGGQQSRPLQGRHGPASQGPQVRHTAARGRGKAWTLPVAVVCQGPLSTHDCARGWGATVQDGRSSPQCFPQLAGRLKGHPLCRALRSVGGGLPRSLHVPDKMPAVPAQAGLPQTAWSPCAGQPGWGPLWVFWIKWGPSRDYLMDR